MDGESSICLSDLVPALRWTRQEQIAEVMADPRLPADWWRSLTVVTTLTTLGVDVLCERLARLAVARWDHVPLTDMLPALLIREAEPEKPDWAPGPRPAPQPGWVRFRRLSPSDLRVWKSSLDLDVTAIIAAAFRDVLGRQIEERQAPPAPPATPHPGGQPAPHQPPPGQAPPFPGARPADTPLAAQAAAALLTPQQQPASPPFPGGQQQAPPLIPLVDNLFRSWHELERAVAVERLFAAQPVNLRALAQRMGVDRDQLSHAQRSAEERILHWLRSPDSAPLTRHLFTLTEWLGVAATEDQLVNADPGHTSPVPSLNTPLWRVLVALMPDRRLQDGWLIVGDIRMLQDRTRQVLAHRTADTDLVELLGQLGIRAHSAHAWLATLPPAAQTAPPAGATPALPKRPVPGSAPSAPNGAAPDPARAGAPPLPRRKPGAGGHHPPGYRDTAQHPPVPAGPVQPPAAPQPWVPDLSTPDNRHWHRIDVSVEHLRGEPVLVPEAYATQLGMRPGTLLSVTGPGDNAVVLVWRDRQPVFDSLQSVLLRLNARPGDHIYINVDGFRLDAQLHSTVA
ncbi:hypothetical protein [Rhizohabitans arisaemae]|uniref:hypothetical protein n=1 Tax=Rhizohabitans arisaemae TaxID=2720610 RepID=UPI0024B09B33|nr:hypothetical protein [Rhizohabitans arisaemae]